MSEDFTIEEECLLCHLPADLVCAASADILAKKDSVADSRVGVCGYHRRSVGGILSNHETSQWLNGLENVTRRSIQKMGSSQLWNQCKLSEGINI